MAPELYKIYKPEELHADWLKFLTFHTRTFNLPTEIVIEEPGTYVPRQGRIYDTDFFITKGEDNGNGNGILSTWDEIRGKDNGSTSQSDFLQISLVEHYENHGDDGHTRMELDGFIFVPPHGKELVKLYGRTVFGYQITLGKREEAKWRHEASERRKQEANDRR